MEEALRRLEEFKDVQVDPPPDPAATEEWLGEALKRAVRDAPRMGEALGNLRLSVGLSDEAIQVFYRWTDEYSGEALQLLEDPRVIFTAGALQGAILALTAEQLSHERRETSE
jgi:hypothetical protein